MGGARRGSSLGTSKTNTQINKAVEQKAATRAYTPPTLDISRIPPIGSYGYNVFRQNITPAERKELDKYVLSLSQPVTLPTPAPTPKSIEEEEVVSLASPFDVSDILKPAENGLVEEGDLGTAFELSTTVTDPTTGIKAFQSTIREQDYGEAPVYADTDTALENYLDFYNRVQAQQTATNRVYNYNNYDPSDFARMGFSGPKSVSNRAGTEVVQDFLTENEIPLSKQIKGQTVYLTTGIGTPESYGARGDGEYIVQGPVGTYSTVFIEDPSGAERLLTNPLVNVIANTVPLGNLVITGAKAATDVDIDPLQAAGGLLQGLEMTGTIRPPAPLPEGVVGPTDAGTGLFGTTYGQTEALVNAVATGDIKETAVGMFGGDLVNEGLAQAGIEASNLGLTSEQLESGIDTTVMAVAQGNELDEALARGFGQEVLEGVVGAIPETDIDFGIIEDTIKPIVETVIDTAEIIAEPFIEVVKEAGPKVEDAIRATGELVEPFVEPIIDVAEAVGPEVEDVVRELGSAADDVLIQPVVEAAETVGPEIEDIIKKVGSETEDIVKAVGGEVIEAVSPIGKAVEDIAKVTGSTVEDVLEGVGEIGEGVVETLGEAISPIGEAIEDIAKVTGSTVEDVLEGVGEITGEAVETLGEAISPIGEAIEDIAKVTGSTVEDVLEGVGEIGEGVVETVGEAIEAGVETVDELLSPIGEAIEDIAKTTGSTVEDVLKGVGKIGEDITKEIGDVGQDVIDALSPIGSALEDIVKTTGSNLEDLLKSLANMMSGAFGSLALQQQEQARQQRIQSALDTRTTDNLFGDELFQFQTEIAISPEYLTPVQAIEPPEEFVDILGNQDTDLDYNYILEDLTKPRSYSF